MLISKSETAIKLTWSCSMPTVGLPPPPPTRVQEEMDTKRNKLWRSSRDFCSPVLRRSLSSSRRFSPFHIVQRWKQKRKKRKTFAPNVKALVCLSRRCNKNSFSRNSPAWEFSVLAVTDELFSPWQIEVEIAVDEIYLCNNRKFDASNVEKNCHVGFSSVRSGLCEGLSRLHVIKIPGKKISDANLQTKRKYNGRVWWLPHSTRHLPTQLVVKSFSLYSCRASNSSQLGRETINVPFSHSSHDGEAFWNPTSRPTRITLHSYSVGWEFAAFSRRPLAGNWIKKIAPFTVLSCTPRS